MEHKPYKRIVEGSKKAVLFVHGIVGTPNHFKLFLPLVSSDLSVHNILLDGHGYSAKDFTRTSMKKWEAQVKQAVDELAATHQEIYIVAHSMGGLLSVEQAIENPKVKKLFLLALPLKLSLKRRMFSSSMKVFLNRISPDDLVALAAKESYGITQDKNPFHYIGWPLRYLELFAKIDDVGKKMALLSTPCSVYQSQSDELVSADTVKRLAKIPSVTVKLLPHSGHYYYEENDMAFLLKEFQAFLSE